MTDRSLLNQAISALRAGDKKRARELLTYAIDEDPDSADTYLYLAFASDDRAGQLAALRRMAAISPNHPHLDKALEQFGLTRAEVQPGAPQPAAAPQRIFDPLEAMPTPASQPAVPPAASPVAAATGDAAERQPHGNSALQPLSGQPAVSQAAGPAPAAKRGGGSGRVLIILLMVVLLVGIAAAVVLFTPVGAALR